MQSILKSARRIVVKVGSSLVTNQGQGLDHAALARWAEQIAKLKEMGKEIVLVSSGAIAEGMQRLGWKKRPHALHELQAAAAVAQMGVVQAYESCFRNHELHAAHDNVAIAEYLEHRIPSLMANSITTPVVPGHFAVFDRHEPIVIVGITVHAVIKEC